MSAEVGAQAVADHVDAEFVDDAGELVDLVGGEELGFIDEDPFRAVGVGSHAEDHLVEVGVGIDPGAFAFDAYAAADHVFIVAGVDHRLHAPVGYLAFLEVIGSCEEKGCFGRPHSAVSEI